MTAAAGHAPVLSRDLAPGRLMAGWEPVLTAAGLLMAASMLTTGGFALSDPRLFDGVGVWIKPLKFQASIALFWLFAGFVFSRLPAAAARGRAGRYVVQVAIAAGLFEMTYIAWRAGRGEASHFNTTSALAIGMYALMGIGAVLMTTTALVQGWMVLRGPDRSQVQRALGWGLVLTFVLGTFTGAYMSAQPGHFVGGPSTGGLPLLGWSTTTGDLRGAHFLGIHAAQILPVMVLVGQRLFRRDVAGLVIAAALVVTLATAWAFALAVAGLPLIRL